LQASGVILANNMVPSQRLDEDEWNNHFV
jgi:hypothetical protein